MAVVEFFEGRSEVGLISSRVVPVEFSEHRLEVGLH